MRAVTPHIRISWDSALYSESGGNSVAPSCKFELAKSQTGWEFKMEPSVAIYIVKYNIKDKENIKKRLLIRLIHKNKTISKQFAYKFLSLRSIESYGFSNRQPKVILRVTHRNATQKYFWKLCMTVWFNQYYNLR